MTFKVNNVDLTPYIANQGLKFSRNDVDGTNAGRTLDGTMIRDRVAIKAKWEVSCRPLTASELSTVLTAINPEFVTVVYTDPITNTTVTKRMYSNNVPAQYLLKRSDGTEWWMGVTFPLIEK